MSERGFTLIEALIALGLLGIVLAGLVPSFISFLDANSASEERSNAVAAGQQVMELLRRQDPASLPGAGSSTIHAIDVGEHEFEVVARYCVETSYCSASSRHIVVEVLFAGDPVYEIETVYARLQ